MSTKNNETMKKFLLKLFFVGTFILPQLGITTCFLAAAFAYYSVKLVCNRPAIDALICLVLRKKTGQE